MINKLKIDIAETTWGTFGDLLITKTNKNGKQNGTKNNNLLKFRFSFILSLIKLMKIIKSKP